MVDIVERLRIRIHTSEDETALTNEAADEIERLQEEHHDVRILNEQYYNENAILIAEIERVREALLMWDALIQHKYNGSRQAMNDMTDAAQHTAQVLYGDPPWPDPKPALQQKDTE